MHFIATANIAIFVVMILGAAIFGQPVFSVVQILWLSLIINIFGAFAFATERPQLGMNDQVPAT